MVVRSAKTGRYVPNAEAELNPDTTVRERMNKPETDETVIDEARPKQIDAATRKARQIALTEQRRERMRTMRKLMRGIREPKGRVMDEVTFTGVKNGRPRFKFADDVPPPWLRKAVRLIEVKDEKAFVNGNALEPGQVLKESDV